MSSTQQTDKPYFESKYLPDDAKRLNSDYVQYLNSKTIDQKKWQDYESKRNDCMKKASEIPDMVRRMEQFDECPKAKMPPDVLTSDKYFYQQYSSFHRNNDNFMESVKVHGLFDAYYLANEKYINIINESSPNRELCRQKGKLVSFGTLLKCMNMNYEAS